MLYNKHINKKGEPFTIEHFKRLLLNFIISNNISFKAIIVAGLKSGVVR